MLRNSHLAVVHGVVQGHEGALVVTSAPEQGSSFELFLPARIEAPATGEVRPLDDAQVMLVDDQVNVARSSAVLLNQLGYRTTVFTDPLEALEAFRQQPERFDLVMTDLSMPRMSGAQLASAMRAIRPALPVILTSGRAVTEQERTVLGAAEILEKPWRLDEALLALRRALNRQGPPSRPASPR